MNLQDALQYLNHGIKVARSGWNGKDMYVIKVLNATANIRGETITYEPHLVLRTPDGRYIPWTISQADAMANDYVLIRVTGIDPSPKPPVATHPAAIIEPLDQEPELPTGEPSSERMPLPNPDMPMSPPSHTVQRNTDTVASAVEQKGETEDDFAIPTPS